MIIRRLQSFVLSNLDRQLTIQEMARATATSPRTLARKIAAMLGTTPRRFAQRLRVRHALHLLETTDRSTDDIASAVGYADSAAFRRVFRREVGDAPRSRRARARESEPPMIPDPDEFTRDWIAAWNAHDLPRILAHYSDDFEMSSPYVAQLVGEASGTLRGKERVAAYWQRGLEHLPELHFELLATYAGTSSIAIHYRGAQGKTVIEVFFFDADGRVTRAAAHYAPTHERRA